MAHNRAPSQPPAAEDAPQQWYSRALSMAKSLVARAQETTVIDPLTDKVIASCAGGLATYAFFCRLYHLYQHTGQIVEMRMRDGNRVHVIAGDSTSHVIYKEIYLDRCYFKHGITLEGVAAPVVVDIGANIGLFSRWCAENLPSETRIYSAEPIPELHQCATQNCAPYRNRVFIHQLGIFEKTDVAEFEYNPMASAGSSMMTEAMAGPLKRHGIMKCLSCAFKDGCFAWPWWTPVFMFLHHTLKVPVLNLFVFVIFVIPLLFCRVLFDSVAPVSKRKVSCRLRTLDQMLFVDQGLRPEDLPVIDLLKIDVEAAEWSVLMGISDNLWPRIRQVVVEVSDIEGRCDAIVELLKAKGFDNVIVDVEDWEVHKVFDIKTVFATKN